jgi:hypothetical protein
VQLRAVVLDGVFLAVEVGFCEGGWDCEGWQWVGAALADVA